MSPMDEEGIPQHRERRIASPNLRLENGDERSRGPGAFTMTVFVVIYMLKSGEKVIKVFKFKVYLGM